MAAMVAGFPRTAPINPSSALTHVQRLRDQGSANIYPDGGSTRHANSRTASLRLRCVWGAERFRLIYLVGLLLSAVSFLLQTWPRFGNRHFGIDVWRHLAVAEYYRQRRRDPNAVFDRYLIPEPSDYPPLLRILLSWIPKQTLESAQWFLGPMFDFVQSYAVFVTALALTDSLAAALAAQGAYMLAPVVVMENSSLSTRPLASLLFTGLLLSEMGHAVSGSWAWLPLSLTMGTLLFLTHRMGLQALAVVSISLSVWFSVGPTTC